MNKGELKTIVSYAEGPDDKPVKVNIEDACGQFIRVPINSVSWYSDMMILNVKLDTKIMRE